MENLRRLLAVHVLWFLAWGSIDSSLTSLASDFHAETSPVQIDLDIDHASGLNAMQYTAVSLNLLHD